MTADLPGLSVNRVSVTYRNGHTALRDATFSVPRGSIAALVGINRFIARCARTWWPMSRNQRTLTGPSRYWWRMSS